jgi:hypothetical protein
MSYHTGPHDAVRNAATLVRAGAQAIKLEGGAKRVPVIDAIVDAEIPVMGHLGLTPQSMHAMGGFRVQAKTSDAAMALVEEAKALEHAGCFSIVLEGIPDVVANLVTESVSVPHDRYRRRCGHRRPGVGLHRPARPRPLAPTEVRAALRRGLRPPDRCRRRVRGRRPLGGRSPPTRRPITPRLRRRKRWRSTAAPPGDS